MFLTPDEMVELTGRKQHGAQAKALTHLSVIYKIRPDGSLLVLRAHVEQLLGAGIMSTAKQIPQFEPNWAAANEHHAPSATMKETK